MYLTYSEYGSMGGKLDKVAFERYALRAQTLIGAATHGRIEKEYPVRACARYAAFDVIEAMVRDAENGADTHEITSMSNDGASISYAVSGDDPTVASRKRYMTIVRGYMLREVDAAGTPLLYAGVEA